MTITQIRVEVRRIKAGTLDPNHSEVFKTWSGKINDFLRQNWKEIAAKLKDHLTDDGNHCPNCFKRHTRNCINGGRCSHCGSSLYPNSTVPN